MKKKEPEIKKEYEPNIQEEENPEIAEVEKPFTHKDTTHDVMSDEEMERQALKNTIMMGGVVK